MTGPGTLDGGAVDLRALYARAVNPEEPPVGARHAALIRAQIQRQAAPGRGGPTDLHALGSEAQAWSKAETARYRELADRLTRRDSAAEPVLSRRVALNCAPLLLPSGAWLQWLSSPAGLDDPAVLMVLGLYASDVGVGQPRMARGNSYLALLRAMGLAANAEPLPVLAREDKIMDGSFYLPAILLTLSRRPDEWREEILGADLCLRMVGLLPPLAIVRDQRPLDTDWTALDLGAARQPGEEPACQRCLHAVAATVVSGSGPGGVADGFRWALATLRRWSADQFTDLEAAGDPRVEMAELLRARARQGAVYHQSYRLAGRTLAEWLRDAALDPGPFMAALASSPLVTPGHPDQSLLVGNLMREGGAMFRVFTSYEVAVIRRWIAGLPECGTCPGKLPDQSPRRWPVLAPGVRTAKDPRLAPVGLRDAYHGLATRADWPALRRWARGYARDWLIRTRATSRHPGPHLPRRWQPGVLRAWLSEQHERGNADSSGGDFPVPSRKDVIDACVQAAPFKLIDGAWLQGFTDYGFATSEAGHPLFATYWDELGNGQPGLNHPHIYRELLSEMGVVLPPTGSREFVNWPGFREQSFRIPVYWLSISRFPKTFMPELLGLNLATELSGVVSGGHRRDRAALAAHGFSTRWPDIHMATDNVVGGHSAWAIDAIDAYLAAVSASQGATALASAWNRVKAGYQSFHPPPGPSRQTAAITTQPASPGGRDRGAAPAGRPAD